MFTGLVESIGRILAAGRGRSAMRLAISAKSIGGEFRGGESVSVDGACLTISTAGRGRFEADVISETLARTTLGGLRPGDRVHLERALRLGDRVGGHLVQGHVDAVLRVTSVVRRGSEWRLRIRLPADLARFVAPQGSIAIAGVSLTVAGVGRGHFEVALVPETIERTYLGSLRAGAEVNVEVDLLARYLDRLRRGGRGSREIEEGPTGDEG